MRPVDAELRRLERHSTGNRAGREVCTFYAPIQREEPGAVGAYARYMATQHHKRVKTRSG